MKRIFPFVIAIIFVISMLFTAVSVSAENLDTSELEAAMAQAEEKLNNASQYTETSISMLQNAYDEAVVIMEAAEFGNCTQTGVDDATSKLLSRIDSLSPVEGGSSSMDSSRTALKATIEKAKAMKFADYTLTTQEWNEFQTMISESEKALENVLYAQTDIQIFNSNLESVIQQVEARKKNNNSEELETNENTESKSETTLTTETLTGTQETTPPTEKVTKVYPKYTASIGEGGFVYLGCDSSIAISALAVVGIIGAAVAIKKKED